MNDIAMETNKMIEKTIYSISTSINPPYMSIRTFAYYSNLVSLREQ